jgi:CRISPR-associated protein Cmr6
MPNYRNPRGARPHQGGGQPNQQPTPPKQECFAPKDTLDTLGKNYQPDNYALYLQKLAIKEDIAFRFFFEPTGDSKKSSYLQKVPTAFNCLAPLLTSLQTRQAEQLTTLCSETSKQLKFKPDWRMIIGLGGASVYETSITLHHVYGIPYIPASAVKGVVRSCWIQEVFGYEDKDESKDEDKEKDKYEKRALKNDDFRAVFGGPKCKDAQGKELKAQAGDVLFFDAFPLALSEKSIQADIMNPHYGDYYGESYDDKHPPKTWPTDTQNPVPVHFLTVANTTFSFAFGCRPGTKNATHLLTLTERYLCQALTERGIGAKSAVGYGYMNPNTG